MQKRPPIYDSDFLSMRIHFRHQHVAEISRAAEAAGLSFEQYVVMGATGWAAEKGGDRTRIAKNG